MDLIIPSVIDHRIIQKERFLNYSLIQGKVLLKASIALQDHYDLNNFNEFISDRVHSIFEINFLNNFIIKAFLRVILSSFVI